MTTAETFIAEEFASDMFPGYVEALLWTTSMSEEDDRSLLDLNYSPDDLSHASDAAIVADIIDFVEGNAEDLHGMNPGQAGHDFLLTRNGHGTGFWDRGLGDKGDRLADASRVYGETNAYIGDDDLVYVA